MKFKLDRKFLKKRRLFLELSQEQLADRAGITRKTIIDLERGNLDTRISTFLKIIEALECSPGLYFTIERG